MIDDDSAQEYFKHAKRAKRAPFPAWVKVLLVAIALNVVAILWFSKTLDGIAADVSAMSERTRHIEKAVTERREPWEH